MHQHDIRLGRCEPWDELVLAGNVGGKVSSMSFVLAVVGESTALAGKRADKVDVCVSTCDKFLPEECTPTTLYIVLIVSP